jgi:tetratricopeptide (TPR) repeat protein
MAYAGLAAAYGLSISYGHPDLNGYQLYGRAMELANRAIALDSNSAEAFAVRGYVESMAFGPADQIDSDFRRALELTPSSADAHGWYAHFLAREERHEQALVEAETAIAIDPLAPGRRLGFAFDALVYRSYDLVVRETQRALALEPGLAVPRMLEAIASLLMGQPEHGAELVRGLYPALWAMCQHSRGHTAEAAQAIDSLRNTLDTSDPTAATHSDMVAYRDIATYYAWIGESDEALSWLERAFALSHNAVDSRVFESGVFDNVRNDRRFRRGFEELRNQMHERLRQERLGIARQ